MKMLIAILTLLVLDFLPGELMGASSLPIGMQGRETYAEGVATNLQNEIIDVTLLRAVRTKDLFERTAVLTYQLTFAHGLKTNQVIQYRYDGGVWLEVEPSRIMSFPGETDMVHIRFSNEKPFRRMKLEDFRIIDGP